MGKRGTRANHKWFRNLAISRIVSEALEALNLKFPEPTVDIGEIKKKYHAIVAGQGKTGSVKNAKKRKKK